MRKSPAKINLTLEILGRRPDGYHELITVFQAVQLFDTLSFDWNAPSKQLICDNPAVPAGDENLIFKAVRALEKHLGKNINVAITLQKQIPMGAGLGGGSSNAASVLLEAAQQFHIPPADLQSLAALLGSDVPFFLNPGTAVGKGRGEILEQLPPFPEYPLVIIKPPFSISTPFAYSQVKRYSTGQNTYEFLSGLRQKQDRELFRLMENDFEEILFPHYPQLLQIKQKFMTQGALAAGLSGSGSALFAFARDLNHAETMASQVRNNGQTWVVKPWP